MADKTTTFRELGLDENVNRALRENGLEEPFPIQAAAIPLILQGKDVVGQAHTGTGKTAAFALPLLTMIKNNNRPVQALVLVPTRELAVQVTNEIVKFSRYTQTRTVSIYGGQSYGLQQDRLRRGVQIVVATPGRLIDHVKRGTIKLEGIKYLVLDEADRMLDMGFIDDIKFILSRTDRNGGGSGGRQTMLFSATMPPEILRLAKEHMKKGNTQEVRLNTEEVSLKNIEQSYLMVSEQEKFVRLVDIMRPVKEQMIVFAATKNRTDRLTRELRQEGFRASGIHGDLHQKQRDTVMQRFRKGADSVLVATDIAARGIDVPAVGQVINYDVPIDPETYFHRIGRTARAGAEGKAITLVTPERFSEFQRILRQAKTPLAMLNESMGIAVPAMRHGRQGGFHHGKGRSGKGQRRNFRRR
jgi:ATP-dependent RNA helicase DeaD